MKSFATALLATAINARTGGIDQGYDNASLGASHGYGYNVGNGYKHGDSHLQYMGDNNITTYEDGYSYDNGVVEDEILHIYGYDMIPRIGTTSWEAMDANAGVNGDFDAQVDLIIAQIDLSVVDRTAYIQDVLDRRRERLEEIHADNSIKIVAPFELQLDLLEEEVEDVTQARAYAVEDLTDAQADLIERMQDYLDDRLEAMDLEVRKIERLIERAVDEGKSVADVVYGMKLDWLSGLFFQGAGNIIFDSGIFDDSVYDNEFDMFTFDIGQGKGHGHRDTTGPGNPTEIGMVVGRGGSGDISTLRGEPVARDGTRRRYDKMTQNGNGSNGDPSNYSIGISKSQADGAYGYNQAADMGLQNMRPAAPKRAPRRRRAQRPTARRPQQARPTQRRSAQRRPATAAPKRRPVQRRPS